MINKWKENLRRKSCRARQKSQRQLRGAHRPIVCLSVALLVCLSVCLPISLSVFVFVYPLPLDVTFAQLLLRLQFSNFLTRCTSRRRGEEKKLRQRTDQPTLGSRTLFINILKLLSVLRRIPLSAVRTNN